MIQIGNLIHIWAKICESNTFNFVVMVILLAWLIKKFDIKSKIEDGRKKIASTIEESEKARDESIEKYYQAQEKTTQIDEDMLKVFKQAEENAHSFGKKMVDEAHNTALLIKENSKKAIEANIQSTKNVILKETAEEALDLAQRKIIAELEQNPELHHKYINESIESLNNIGENGVNV